MYNTKEQNQEQPIDFTPVNSLDDIKTTKVQEPEKQRSYMKYGALGLAIAYILSTLTGCGTGFYREGTTYEELPNGKVVTKDIKENNHPDNGFGGIPFGF